MTVITTHSPVESPSRSELPRNHRSSPHPILVLVATVASLLLAYNFIFLAIHIPKQMTSNDFAHYYATAWLARNGFDIYRTDFNSTPLATELAFHPAIPRATNPPALVVLTIPLALLRPTPAWLTLLCLIFLSGLGCLLVMHGVLWQHWKSHERGFAILLFIAASWLPGALYYSQIQPFILLLVLSGWSLLRKTTSFVGGFLWGIAAAIKLYTWPLLLFLLFRGQWRPIAGGLLGVATGLCLPLAVLGPRVYSDFLKHAPGILDLWSAESAFNISLGGTINTMSVLLFHFQPFSLPLLRRLLGTALPALSMILLAAMLATKTPARAKFDIGTAILASLSFLCGAVAWPNYLLVTAFPLSVAWNYSRKHVSDATVLITTWLALQTKADGGSFVSALFRTNVILPPPAAVIIVLAVFLWFRYGRRQVA
jgi:Glycosyltransferase family 87